MTENGRKFCDVCNDMGNIKTYQVGRPSESHLIDLCEKCEVFFEGLPIKEIIECKGLRWSVVDQKSAYHERR